MKKTLKDIARTKKEDLYIEKPRKEEKTKERRQYSLPKISKKTWKGIGFVSIIVFLVSFWIYSIQDQAKKMILTLQETKVEAIDVYKNLQKERKKLGLLLLPVRPVQAILPWKRNEVQTAFLSIDILSSIEKLEKKMIKILKKSVRNERLNIKKMLIELSSESKSIQKEQRKICKNIQTLGEKLTSNYIQKSGASFCTKTESVLTGFINNTEVWEEIYKEPAMRIMVLNQNNDELRANGGFPGSAFFIDVEKGEITNVHFTDIYALDWDFVSDLPSPEGIDRFFSDSSKTEPIQLYVRDANYYPNFQDSLLTINTLLEKSGRKPVDMLVGINLSLLEDIVTEVGAIQLYGEDIQPEELSSFLSIIVESKIAQVESPKDVLKQVLSQLQKYIQTHKEELAVVLMRNIHEGEVLIASTNSSWQDALDQLEIFEPWKHTDKEYIYPLFTSYSKNKSDRYAYRDITITTSGCNRSFRLDTFHGYNNSIEKDLLETMKTLKIENTEEMLKVQGKGANSHFIRLIVPKGTQLQSGPPQVRIEESDTYASINWHQSANIGDTSTVSFTYTTPGSICNKDIYMYKQPGLQNVTYSQVGEYTFTTNF